MDEDARARTRAILRRELAEEASAFCVEHGFDAVTVDDIARGIGISRATFFRYFASKEDAVVATAQNAATSVAAEVRALARAGTTSAMELVRLAMRAAAEGARRDPERLRARFRMVVANPALRAALAASAADQRAELEDALSDLVADRDRARAVAAVATAALGLAWTMWTADEDGDFAEVLDRAFALVDEAGGVRIVRTA